MPRFIIASTAVLVGLAGMLVVSQNSSVSAAATAGVATLGQPGGGTLSSGGSGSVFEVRLPSAASCTGDTSGGGYVLESYIVPSSVSPDTLTFDANGPTPAGTGANLRQPLFSFTGTIPFVNGTTGVATNAGGPGLVVGLPTFSFKVFGAAGHTIVPAGRYNLGIACWNTTAAPNVLDKYWNVVIDVVADVADVPGGFTWTTVAVTPPTTTIAPTTTAASTTTAAPTTTVAPTTTAVPTTTTMPDLTKPTVAMNSPLEVYRLNTNVLVRWVSADKGGSGLASTQIRYRKAAATGTVLSAYVYPPTWAKLTVSQFNFAAALGTRYCFSAQAKDHKGNLSAWTAEKCTTVPFDDRTFTASKAWSKVAKAGKLGWFANTASVDTTMGATLTSVGTKSVVQVGLVATRCSTCGMVKAYVGTKLVATFNLAGATGQRVVFTSARFAKKTGVVKFVVTSTKKTVAIDGIILSAF
jgi:hypothetical protein